METKTIVKTMLNNIYIAVLIVLSVANIFCLTHNIKTHDYLKIHLKAADNNLDLMRHLGFYRKAIKDSGMTHIEFNAFLKEVKKNKE